MKFQLISDIAEIEKSVWNGVCGESYPFLYWEFLHALEASGAVDASTGWQAQHVIISFEDRVIAIMPMYLKGNSQGEYVFDHSWAHAYSRHGLAYFPKMLTAIPFTPCQGPRICFANDIENLGLNQNQLFDFILENLKHLARQHQISSWHCLFPESEQLLVFKHDDVYLREGVQFQWFNKGYSTFDDFLETLTSKRRKNLKRERRRITEQGISVSQLIGKQITEAHWKVFFEYYQSTYWKRGMPEYLTLDFFLDLAEAMPENLLLVIAEKDEKIVATALSIIGSHTLYGRYWGCLQDYDNLHFELCYYQGIAFCIEKGLQCFNSGAQGEHKIARGFEPVMTYSLHWIAHEGFRKAIADFLQEENEYMHRYKDAAGELLPFNSKHSLDKL